MPEVVPYNEWMKKTYSYTKPRSTELKAIDSAIKQFHTTYSDSAYALITASLIRWVTKEGAKWRDSVRNKTNMIDTLYRQTIAVKLVKQSGAEMVALSSIRDESRALVIELFRNQKLVYRKGLVTKLAGNGAISKATTTYTVLSLGNNVDKASGRAASHAVRGGVNQARTAITGHPSRGGSSEGLATKLFNELIPTDCMEDVRSLLSSAMPDFMAQWAASLMPVIGLVTSGGGVIVSAAGALRKQWILENSQMHAERTMSEDEPAAAFTAVIRIMERERNKSLAGLALGLSTFAGKLAGVLADGGTATNTAISIASGVIKLTLLIGIAVRDVLESRAANKVMLKPHFGTKIFEECPIMGAYFICCVPTSVIVNVLLSSDKFYQPGMQDKVEHAVRQHIQPLREKARDLVKEYRLYFPHLMNSAALMEVNKKNLKQMVKKKGHTEIGTRSMDMSRKMTVISRDEILQV